MAKFAAILTTLVMAALPATAFAENGNNASLLIGGVAGFGLGTALSGGSILGALKSGGLAADAMCNPVIPSCPCGQVPTSKGCQYVGPQANKFMCPPGPTICQDTTSGSLTIGTCIAPNKCQGVTTNGKGVDTGLSSLGQILGQVVGKLLQGGSSGSGSGSGTGVGTYPTTPTTGCTGSYFQTSDITQLSNPCAQYVPPVTPPIDTGTSSCDTLSQLLGTCSGTPACPAPAAITCSPGYSPAPQLGTDSSGCALPNQCVINSTDTSGTPTVSPVLSSGTTSTTTGTNLAGLGSPLLLAPGLNNGTSGDLSLSGNGATIFSSSQDIANNTGVAGFFGSDTFGSQQPQGIAAQMCQARPWAGGFWGSILPVAFFDGLCTSRGFQVGPPPAPVAPVVQLQQTTPAPKPVAPAPAPAATSTATVPSVVQIWAVPASVPLATRTSIFWNTQGVTQCTETSPDGSFNQSSLSGGAATVPLTNATTFTISCIDSGGNPVTNYVTVNLSI